MSVTTAGAYGLRLSSVEPGWLAVDGGAHWPEVRVVRESARDAPELRLDLRARELRVRSDIPDTELIHPLLGRVGAQLSLSRGYERCTQAQWRAARERGSWSGPSTPGRALC